MMTLRRFILSFVAIAASIAATAAPRITASVDKIEYSDLETRVYMTVKNDSSDNVSLDVYGIKLIMDGQQIAQDDNSVSSFNGNYAELNYDIAAGASSSGILVFPAIEQKKDFQVVLTFCDFANEKKINQISEFFESRKIRIAARNTSGIIDESLEFL